MGLSSATIRNEMSDLEELGFLDQPHVSAGRIPSAKAYRLYVDELIRAHEFTNLKGLLYFTDGFGRFPAHQPDYDTAFVFLENEGNQYEVPPWAIRLTLEPEEILEEA